MGRPPKPDNLKRLTGTYRKDRKHGDTVTSELLTDVNGINFPEYIPEKVKRIFMERATILINQRVLTPADLDYLLIYADQLNIYWQCSDEYSSATDEKLKYILLKIMNQARTVINSIGGQFGFSPATRLKTGVHEEEDEFEKFLKS
jgi:P27 family predicted phage terminase small subunit